ncbi:hypothetical protein [Streptococcus loxodontisalivarius]|uniref:Uncharacterized protein n=1 Tax=Streptococcus loxodontisalivarius TaxID=1349415 RepID=A0ABS2PS56_9STRE|nr:hypothetical protein [Streptococcus loxodontisalivarius]MBM7642761.1 hypothetical protein [Streptococcus loxodontisalivarius]
MMKRLFQANFEESLNLLDDTFIKYMVDDLSPRKAYKNRFVKLFFSIMGILFLYGLAFLTNKVSMGEGGKMAVNPLHINLLPQWLFYSCAIIWIVIVIWSLFKRYTALEVEFSILTVTLYIFGMLLFINLFFAMFFANEAGILTFICLNLLNLLVIFLTISNKYKALLQNLFNDKSTPSKFEASLMKLIKYFFIFILIWIFVKRLFPEISNPQVDIMGLIYMVGMLEIVNLFSILAIVYCLLPYLLLLFYKFKYSEDYRNFEGKTEEEWYGKKFKRYEA